MKKTRTNFLIALAAAAAVTLLFGSGILGMADRWAQDLLFQRPGAASPEIVIIGIDDRALEELGPYHTWSREIMASALERLGADPERMPAVTAVDTLYAGESDPAADARLAAAAKALPAMVTAAAAEFGTAYTWAEDGRVMADTYAVTGFDTPYSALRQAAHMGHINAMYDSDGILRHGILYVETPEEGRVWSMARETARLYLESRGRTIREPETDARGRFYVPYTGLPGAFSDGWSLAELIRGEMDPEIWAGKIVLIGPWASGLQDAYYPSISRSRQMYGVEVQANVIQSFLEETFKAEAPERPQIAALFLLSLGLGMLLLRLRVSRAAMAAVGAVVLGAGISLGLYAAGLVTHALWLPGAALVLLAVAVVRHYMLAAAERQRVTRTFERYVAPEIVQEILKEGQEGLRLGGSLRQIAVLFVDIRGFTSMSERLDPERVVQILNRYLAMTSGCVARNRGTLDKFVGDATMAFWGAPVESEDPVYAAAKTALEIRRETAQLSEQLRSETGETLRVGVGVHYGPAVVGNMGSERRMDYTAIGDTVNTAARLEANAPADTVYISRAVADALGDRARTRSLGDSVRLKGKAEGFEVLILEELEEKLD